MIRISFYLLVIFAALFLSDATHADYSIENEFKIRQKAQKNRYKDFYRQKKKSKLFDQQRLNGLEAYHKKKKEREQKLEKDRITRIKARKDPSLEAEKQSQWERAHQKRIEKRIQKQKKYVQRRDRLREKERTLEHIPLEQELDLPEWTPKNK